MSNAIRAIIAGLGAGASSLGTSLDDRDKEDRAMQMLLEKEKGQSTWGNTFSAIDDQGPGLFQENKRTGEVRRVQPTAGMSAGPSATAQGVPSPAVAAVAKSAPTPSSNRFGGYTAPPVIADTNPPAVPKPSGLRPYTKPTPESRQLVKNKAGMMVSVDRLTGLDASGKPVEGYQPPTAPVHDVPITTVDASGKPTVTWGNPVTHAVTPSGLDKPKPGSQSGSGAQTSLSDLLRTHHAMAAVENDPHFGISGSDETQEALDYAKKRGMAQPTASTPITTIGSTVMNAVHAPNDKAITYLQNSRSFGEDAAQAFKGRTNEERVLRDVANSRLDKMTATLPGERQAVQSRRANIIAMAASANPEQLDALSPADRAEIQKYMGTSGSPPAKTPTRRLGQPKKADAAAIRTKYGLEP